MISKDAPDPRDQVRKQASTVRGTSSDITYFILYDPDDRQNQIHYFQTKEEPTDELIQQIITIDILQIGWNEGKDNDYEIFRNFPVDFQGTISYEMKIRLDPFFPYRDNKTVHDALWWEKNWNFKLVDSNFEMEEFAKRCIDTEEPLYLLIEWNNLVKKQNSASFPLLLLTTHPTKQHLILKDLRMVLKPNDATHLWRIFWDELTALEKLHSFLLCFFQQNEGDTFQMGSLKKLKLLNINDFFTNETEFKQVTLPNVNIPESML